MAVYCRALMNTSEVYHVRVDLSSVNVVFNILTLERVVESEGEEKARRLEGGKEGKAVECYRARYSLACWSVTSG